MRKIWSLWQRLWHNSLFRYVLYRFAALVCTLAVMSALIRPDILALRNQNAEFLSSLVQKGISKEGIHSQTLALAGSFGDFWKVRLWLVDEAGEVLVSTINQVLPKDWEDLKRPQEELVPIHDSYIPKKHDDIFVSRLVITPPRFLVFYFENENPGTRIVIKYLGWIILWFFGTNLIGLYFLLKSKDNNMPPPRPPLTLSENGFSLLSAILALVILSIGMLAMQSMMQVSFRTSAHADLSAAVRSLSESVKAQTDCEKTLHGVNLAQACSSTNPVPLTLRDRNGVPIAGDLTSTERIDPLDASLEGSARYGNWSLRAYCDNPTSGNLVVRFARANTADKPVEFFQDPLNKRRFAWTDSPVNPLYGTASRTLCQPKSNPDPTGGGGVATHIEKQLLKPLPITDPMRNCTQSFGKNGKLYLLSIGAPEYILLIPDSILYTATVQCPEGKKAIAGGAQCGAGFSQASAVASLGGAGKAPGYLAISQPTEDGKGWSVACCIEGWAGFASQSHGYAVCVP